MSSPPRPYDNSWSSFCLSNVIVSTGIAHTNDQKWDELMKLGKPVQEIAMAWDPDALRYLTKRSVHKYNVLWVPDFSLWDFILLKEGKTRKQKEELIEYLVSGEAGDQLPNLSQINYSVPYVLISTRIESMGLGLDLSMGVLNLAIVIPQRMSPHPNR